MERNLADEIDLLDEAEDLLIQLQEAMTMQSVLAQRDPMLVKMIAMKVGHLRRDLDRGLIELFEHNELEAARGLRILVRWRSVRSGGVIVLTRGRELRHKRSPLGTYEVVKTDCTLDEAKAYIAGQRDTFQLYGVPKDLKGAAKQPPQGAAGQPAQA